MQNHPSARFTSSSSAPTAAFRFLSCLLSSNPPTDYTPSSIFLFYLDEGTQSTERPMPLARFHREKPACTFAPPSCKRCARALITSSAQSFQSRLLSIIEAAFNLKKRNTISGGITIFFKMKFWNEINEANLVLLKMHVCF